MASLHICQRAEAPCEHVVYCQNGPKDMCWLEDVAAKAAPGSAVLVGEAPRQARSTMAVFSHGDYEKLVQDTVAAIQKLSTVKGGEYAGDTDRLANFRRNGADVGLPMEVIWRVYAGKHWDSITQYIKDLASGKERPRSEPLEGRCDDLIVYLILLKAMLRERGQP